MCHPKIKLGVTGGIGSGKSYVCRILEQCGIPVFNCDTNARNEMTENHELQNALCHLVASDVIRNDGKLNKPAIRHFLHSSPYNAEKFNALVHPCVRMRWQQWTQTQTANIVAMECALLYESHFEIEVDLKILVVAPLQLRISRVMKRDGIDAKTVEHWISMQLPDDKKAALSDFIIINDGISDVQTQISDILAKI